jgi:PAS domain S-box-containing protein
MRKERKLSRLSAWIFSNPKLTGWLLFAILLSTVSYIVSRRYHIIQDNERREMSNILQVVQQNINQNLKNCYATTLTLSLTLNDEGKPENFDSIGQKLIEANPFIDAVQLVPDGVIKYVHPLKGNERAMNFDVINSKIHRAEALKAIENKKLYFAGPVELQQGGLGIIGRLPIFKNNKFWGFSAVLIRLETMLNASGINSIDNSKYYFQFSKFDKNSRKEVFFLDNKQKFNDKNFQKGTIPEGGWKIYLINKNQYGIIVDVLPSSILGFLFSAFLTLFIYSLLKKPAELQQLIHNQATKLLNNELKFKTIFQQAAVGIVHVNTLTGKLIEINAKFSQMLGYNFEELLTKSLKDITHPEDLDENYAKLDDLKNQKIRSFSMQKRYIHKDGSIIWVNMRTSPLWKKTEKPSTHISIIEDITQQKLSDEAIIKSEIRFKSLFEDSPIALWEEDFSLLKKFLDENNFGTKSEAEIVDYLNANSEFVKHCISLVKIININNECLTLHHPKTKQELMSNLDNVLNNDAMDSFKAQILAISKGEIRLVIDSKVKKTDGEYRYISLRWNVMPGHEDTLERVIISTEDITARKASEEIIIQSQKKLESLIDTIDGIVWECDFDSYIFTYVNNKAEEITGYTKEEWMSHADFWGDTVHPDDRDWVLSFCSIQSKTNARYDFEYRMLAKDGSTIWIRDIVNVIKENDKPVSLKGIMIDITKSKEAEKDLNNSFNLVNEQNKRLLNFSYIVSHNLRSHTSNIQSISSLIESSDSEEERFELINMLQNVSSTLNETMLNLNEVVNIQTNINLIMERLSLKENINKTLKILSEQIQFKKAIIKNNIAPEVFVNYNPAYLESILLNFISNALRYSHPFRTPTISLESYIENGKTVLEIADNGIGIDLKKYGDKLFGMYKTFHENPDSKGIKLFITKNQIDAMDGNVTVESEPNIGTTFKIYFK